MKQYLLRLISSADHNISREELIKIIIETGSDRYDSSKKQVFNEYYEKFDVDFFAECDINESNLADKIAEAVNKFPDRTKGDRGYAVTPDIAIIYNADKCEMIDGVYDYKSGSDCFRFKTSPVKALHEVRKL